ncbi:hypothetical protein TIFTF001_021119 [Ficus carica]|uniref:Uncharacterized protein n=1 Tax=Ficus carica TaxID=3494 RepID=A0AA88AF61_FICCA|nr:hypothetical protein TIFTF001_021119 [Ficus carica]
MASPSLLLLQHHHHHHQGLSHFQLKPHKLSLQVSAGCVYCLSFSSSIVVLLVLFRNEGIDSEAIVQRFNEPDLNTSIPASKLNAAKFPTFQLLMYYSMVVKADSPKGITNGSPHVFKVPENLLVFKDIEVPKRLLLCVSTFSVGQTLCFISAPMAHASDNINANAVYEVGELFELGIQLSYLILLLGFLGVGTFFVIRQVLVRRELDLSAKELQEQVRSGDASATEYFELGAVMLRRKFFPAAIKYLLQAIEKWDGDDQDLAQVYNALGVSYVLDGKLDKGITQFETAVKLQPGYVTAWNNLGDAYEKKKEFKSALKAFEEVLLFDPNNKVARPRRDALKEKVEMLRGVPVRSKER